MTYILVPNEGEDLVINAWNWGPIVELLFAAGAITDDDHEPGGVHGTTLKVDEAKALLIAEAVMRKLSSMNPGDRVLANLSISKEPKKYAVFTPDMKEEDIDINELYSTTYEVLEMFVKFCRSSKGFEVM